MDLGRGLSVQGDVDRKAVPIADRRCDNPRRLSEAILPAMRDALEERPRFAAEEGFDQPAPRLGAGLVLKPDDPFTVEGRRAVGDADGVVGHAAASAGSDVPRVDLPDAGLIRGVDDAVRRLRRPFREEGDRRAKALVPRRCVHVF